MTPSSKLDDYKRRMAASEAGWMALAGGILFGLTMAAYYRHLARRHGLGSWSAARPRANRHGRPEQRLPTVGATG